MSRKVMIVSPHFPPINAPDHQRVRMALPYFKEFGWQPTILTVRPECVEGVYDPLLEQSLPRDLKIVHTGALPVRKTRRVGLGNLALRAMPHLLAGGSRCLSRAKFDLVFFSTTMFPVMALGRWWRSRFGVPYVLDFQDPWVSDYHQQHSTSIPPGGRFKYGFSQMLAGRLEPFALRKASRIITVSPNYPETILKRYGWLREDQFTVLPFGAAESDFSFLRQSPRGHSIIPRTDGKEHWAYVGRGGSDMAFALRAFFKSLAQVVERQPGLRQRLRLHFVGTDYAPADRARKSVEPIAVEFGVADMVTEQTQRIPYFQTLQCLLDADALIIPGSDDPGYTASKLYPYILAKRPLLAVFHEQSSVVEVLRATKAGTVVTFASGEEMNAVSDRIQTEWFGKMPLASPATNWTAFEPYTAREMTRKLCSVFDKSL